MKNCVVSCRSAAGLILFAMSMMSTVAWANSSASNQSCAIVTQGGQSLNVAKQQFAAACPGLKRQDCDPVSGNRWMCSTDNISLGSVVPSATTQSIPEPSEPSSSVSNAEIETLPTPVTSSSSDSCAIVTQSGASLGVAKQQFAAACVGLKRKDCDPVSGNRWMCSTDNINLSSPAQATTPQSTPVPVVPDEPVVPVSPAAVVPAEPVAVSSGGVCEAQGSNLGAARQAYASSCPNIPRQDCDPIGNGRWACSSGVLGAGAPSVFTSSGASAPTQQTPTVSAPAAPTSNSSGSIGRVGSNDLVALHYDNCPDRDDGHALASGKAVVVRSGLQNIIVVNGTCSDNWLGSYQSGSEPVARAAWGNQWLDAFNNSNTSIQTSAQRWASVLANGGDVWVAEGGPSDFTAKVLRSIRSQFPALNLKNVHVVQHAHGSGWNESNTSPSNIALIRSAADYVTIPNGNIGGNGSAGLNQLSSFFVSTARQSEFSNEWDAAFNYLSPSRRLDFSDTVELLYLINDTATQSVDDFARNYLR